MKKVIFIILMLCVVFYGLCKLYDCSCLYTRETKVIKIEGTTVSLIDHNGDIWVWENLYEKDIHVLDSVILTMDDMGTIYDNRDDQIKKVKIK